MSTPNHFLGWPVTAPLLARAGAAPDGVRLFAASDLHVTLAFLGRCGEEAARRAFAAVDPAAAAPLRVGFGAVGLMGHPRRGTALAAEVTSADGALAARIEAHRGPLLALAGARPDERPPRPHATLARIRRRASRAERRAALAWASGIALGDLEDTLDRVALYTWSDDRPVTQFRILAATAGDTP